MVGLLLNHHNLNATKKHISYSAITPSYKYEKRIVHKKNTSTTQPITTIKTKDLSYLPQNS